jgi:hypothetical protein
MASKNETNKPIGLPITLETLVPPMFLEPVLRTSFFAILEIMAPKIILPKRYPITANDKDIKTISQIIFRIINVY